MKTILILLVIALPLQAQIKEVPEDGSIVIEFDQTRILMDGRLEKWENIYFRIRANELILVEKWQPMKFSGTDTLLDVIYPYKTTGLDTGLYAITVSAIRHVPTNRDPVARWIFSDPSDVTDESIFRIVPVSDVTPLKKTVRVKVPL